MNSSPESVSFTNTLLSAVRLQRHLAVRVIISTQEPTISTALLNLSTVTIVHRFTSPEWLRILHIHLAAAACDRESDFGDDHGSLFRRIVQLNVGEALLFSPTALVKLQAKNAQKFICSYLNDEYLEIKIRARLTEDGGKSVLAA
jgi:hypothetical protein